MNVQTKEIGADTRSVRKHAPGCYRMTLNDARYFAQFVKGRYTSSAKWGDEFKRDSNGRHWAGEIRSVVSGELIRYAGVHRTLTAAAGEARELQLWLRIVNWLLVAWLALGCGLLTYAAHEAFWLVSSSDGDSK